MATYSACPTLFEASHLQGNSKCHQFNKFIVNKLEKLPRDIPVIIANNLSIYIFGPQMEHDKRFGKPLIYYEGQPQDASDDKFLAKVRDDFLTSSCMIAKQRPTYWIKPIPEMPVDVPRWLARQLLLKSSEAEVKISLQNYHIRNAFTIKLLEEASNSCELNLIDPTETLCDTNHCYGSKKGMPLYYDDHHLSEHGVINLIPIFSEIHR